MLSGRVCVGSCSKRDGEGWAGVGLSFFYFYFQLFFASFALFAVDFWFILRCVM